MKQRKGARKETDRGSGRERCVIWGTLKTAQFQGGYIIEKSPQIKGGVRSIGMDPHTAEFLQIENFEKEENGGRYWTRTSGLRRVKAAL